MKDEVLHHKIYTIYTIIRLAKNSNLKYVLDDKSAKLLTKQLLKNIGNYDFNDHNNEDYFENIDESLKRL